MTIPPIVVRPLVMAALMLALNSPAGIAARADDSPAIEILRAEIGFGGAYKSGYWTPIRLMLKSPRPLQGSVEILAPDGDGVPVAFAAPQADPAGVTAFPANEEVAVVIYAKVGPERSTLSVQLRDPQTGTVLWQKQLPVSTPRPLPSNVELIVALGESRATTAAAALIRRSDEQRVVSAAVADVQHVPSEWWAWEGVETIVISTGADGLSHKLSPAQWQALRQWVEIGGGRIVLCVGERAAEAVGSSSLIAELAPGELADVAPLRDLNQLQEMTGETFAVASDADRPRVARLTKVRGRIESTVRGSSGEVPLRIRASHGFGEVVFLALDPDGPALSRWPGSGRLLLPALTAPGRGNETPSPRRTLSRLGYDDLSGQLRVALDHFPQVRVVNVTMVAVLTLAYLMLIGPVDFLLLRRLKLPSVFTWLSFPLLIGVFCALGWYSARSAHGTAVRVNRCEVIDIDLERQWARGTTWVHVYNPDTSTHDVSHRIDGGPLGLTEPERGWLTWQGLPGNGLGGLGANQLTAPSLIPYRTVLPGTEPAVAGVPIQIAGSKALSARWWAPCRLSDLPSLSVNQFGLLEGEIINPLPVELHEGLLIYDDWMYRVRTLSSKERIRISDFDPLNLEARLQQRTIANAKDVMSPWERDSIDVPRIVQMLMFHDSARGPAYTNLAHRYLSFLDLTPRAKGGRAILVGRLAKPVSRVTMDGEPFASESHDEPWSWVRIVLPVSTSPTR